MIDSAIMNYLVGDDRSEAALLKAQLEHTGGALGREIELNAQMEEVQRVYIATLKTAADEIAVLRKALGFYADPFRYNGPNQRLADDETDPWNPDGVYMKDVTRDGGEIARKALLHSPAGTSDPPGNNS